MVELKNEHMKRTRFIKLWTLTVMYLILISSSKAQIPINDPAWGNPISGSSEEFNAALDTINKWHPRHNWGTRYPNNGNYALGAEMEYPINLIQTTGTTLKIKADTLIPFVDSVYNPDQHTPDPLGNVTIAYQGGTIWSRPINGVDLYKFGYIEIYAKFPGYRIYPLWPGFWLFGNADGLWTDEIDIVENNAPVSYNGDSIGTNFHIRLTSTSNSNNPQDIDVGFILSDAFHKYAIEWAPDRIIWYVDDTPVRTVYDPSGISLPQHAMAVILNFAIDTWYAFLPADWNTMNHGNSLPTPFRRSPSARYFEIDYLRYYKLTTDCTTDLPNLCTPGDYDRKVKRSITTDSGCTPTFNPSNTSDSYILRATDFVTLNAGTTINPTGTGYFAIDIMPCPK